MQRIFPRFLRNILKPTKFSPSKKSIFLSLTMPYFFMKLTKPILMDNYIPALTQEELNSFTSKYPNFHLSTFSPLISLISKLRDKTTETNDFRHYADRIIRIILEESISIQEQKISRRLSPVCEYSHVELKRNLEDFCAVTILRAGNSFMHEALHMIPDIKLGQILIQRNEKSREKEPVFLYAKFPEKMQEKNILVLDPMIASGNSMKRAIKVLQDYGVKEENLTVVGLIGCREGIENIFKDFPNVKIVCGVIDPLLNENKYIAPGLGDFGDRYFGTH